MPLNAPSAGPTLPPRPLPQPPASIEQTQLRVEDHIGVAARPPRRRRTMAILLAPLVALGIWGGFRVASLDSHSQEKARLDVFTPMGFHVETPVFRFDMPDTPKVEPRSISPQGVGPTGTAWTIENDKLALQVVAIDLQQPIDPTMAKAGIDSIVQEIALESNGVVVTEEAIQVDGGSGRRSQLKTDGGWIFTENYVRGTWSVMIYVDSASESPPTDFLNLVASFEFL